jgi:glycosyltransferase involved in cell wall biosynthesis
MTYSTARLKQQAEHIVLLPLVWLGRLIGLLKKAPDNEGIFLIYPNRDTGGSYKVNADIAALLKDKKPLVIFTKKALNGGYQHLFELPGVNILDINRLIDNKYIHFLNVIWRGIISQWIKQHKKPVVFGGECIFFYKLVPHVYKTARCIELCHVNKWLNYTQAFAPFIHYRVFSTQKILRDHAKQYDTNGVPDYLKDRLIFIDNKIEMPQQHWEEHEHLQVLFVGRGAPQKRVHLIVAIAEKVKQLRPEIGFTLVGDVEALVPENVKQLITIRTDINKASLLQPLYQAHDVLLLTSLFEGLPIVVMDMMAQGRVVLSTAVDGIPDYIKHMNNGLLINAVENEDEVVRQGVEWILQLDEDRQLLRKLSGAARAFAVKQFSGSAFDENYLKLFKSNNN